VITLAANKVVPLARMLYVPKQGFRREQLVIEASGPYALHENEEHFVIQNKDCCRAILVTVRARPEGEAT
jgi:hypothetical protein